jgi:DNA-binding XRE family transcriptional regulator
MDTSERTDTVKLETIRTKKGLSQVELDEKAGLRRGTTFDIENGRNQKPAFDTVVRLARVLEVEPEKLFPVKNETAA